MLKAVVIPLIALLTLLGLLRFGYDLPVTPAMLWAACSYGCLIAGLLAKKHRVSAHAGLMTTGIVLDLALVGYLQVTRGAVQTAASFTLSPLQQGHIAASLVATLLYFPVLYSGFKRYRSPGYGPLELRVFHKRVSILALVFRSVGFALMFSMLNRN